MPRTRTTTVSRRIWVIVAVGLSAALHTYVLERLLHLQPQSTTPRQTDRAPLADEELVYEFTQEPVSEPEPVVASPASEPVEQHKPAVLAPTRKPKVSVSAIESDQPETIEYQAPALNAGDLLRQIPSAAAQSVPAAALERPAQLNLGVRANAEDALIKPQRRTAGLGGAPTRGDLAPVGDLANGMLLERWQELHHGQGSQDCSKQPADEPLSSFLARCRQGL